MVFFDSWTDYAVVVLIALAALPVLVAGGFVVFALIALLVLFVFKGIPWLLEFVKERHSGAAAAKKQNKYLDDRRWNR